MLQDVHVRVQRELATADSPVSTVGDVAMGLEVTFLNSAVDSVGKLGLHSTELMSPARHTPVTTMLQGLDLQTHLLLRGIA